MTQPWYRLFLFTNPPSLSGHDAASKAGSVGNGLLGQLIGDNPAAEALLGGLLGGDSNAQSPISSSADAGTALPTGASAENVIGGLLGSMLGGSAEDTSGTSDPGAGTSLPGSTPASGCLLGGLLNSLLGGQSALNLPTSGSSDTSTPASSHPSASSQPSATGPMSGQLGEVLSGGHVPNIPISSGPGAGIPAPNTPATSSTPANALGDSLFGGTPTSSVSSASIPAPNTPATSSTPANALGDSLFGGTPTGSVSSAGIPSHSGPAASNTPASALGDSLFKGTSTDNDSKAGIVSLSGHAANVPPAGSLGDNLFAERTPASSAITSSSVADTLRAILADHDYSTYDPFPGGTGTPPKLKEMVRVFVAPPQDEVICVVGEFPTDLLPELSKRLGVPFLAGWLTEEEGGFAAYHAGQRDDSAAALAPYLRGGQTLTGLGHALAGEIEVPPLGDVRSPGSVLPAEIQALADDKGVGDKASAMFERMSGSLFGKLENQTGSDADQEQARAILTGGEHDLWNSLPGQRVRAVAEMLDLPANWRLPELDTVRDAYHVHRLRQRSPRMPLMPGDQDMLRSVPDALDYVPVYMGRP